MKKSLAAFLVFIMISQNLQAAILLPSIEVPTSDFHARIETSRDKHQTFSSYYLDSRPLQENTNELLKLFETAQTFYFSQSLNQAKEVYTKILFMIDIDEWREVHRKIFFMSYLRLAELDTANESDYLQKATLFAPEISLSSIEINKDLKNKILKIRKNLKSLEWNIAGFKNDFQFILMNGHVINTKKTNKVIIPHGKFRITILSDYYKPQTVNVSAQQVPLLEPVKTAFVNGTCETPNVLNDVEIKNYETYFGKECLNKELQSKTSNPLVPSYNHLPDETSFMTNTKPIYKKPWFWVVLGTVAAGTIYFIAKKNKREGSKSEEPSREVIE